MYLLAGINSLVSGCYLGSRVLVALFALSLGIGPFGIGILVGLYAALSVVLAIHSGKIVDRLGARRPMIWGAAATVVALAIPWAFPVLPTLYVSATLMGGAFIFWNVAIQSLAGFVGKPEDRPHNFSTLALSYSVSSFIGPMAAGFIIEHGGHQLTYGVFTVVAVLGVLYPWFHPTALAAKPRAASTPAPRSDNLWKNPRLARTFVSSGLVVTGWDLFIFYLPLYAHSLGLSPSRIGVLLGIFAGETFVIRFALPWMLRRVGGSHAAETVLSLSMFGAAINYAAFPFVHDPWILAAMCFTIGLFMGCGQPLSLMLAFSRSPEGRTGETNGMRLMVNHVTHFAVPIAAGAAGAAFGMAPVFLASAVLLGLSGWLIRDR